MTRSALGFSGRHGIDRASLERLVRHSTSVVMDEEIKRWTAQRKSVLVLETIQGKTTISEASRRFERVPSEIEG